MAVELGLTYCQSTLTFPFPVTALEMPTLHKTPTTECHYSGTSCASSRKPVTQNTIHFHRPVVLTNESPPLKRTRIRRRYLPLEFVTTQPLSTRTSTQRLPSQTPYTPLWSKTESRRPISRLFCACAVGGRLRAGIEESRRWRRDDGK